jgi:aspartate/methionine/tyrosine aminotransferase
VLVPTSAAERFQLSADKVQAAWGPRTRGVLLASPSNPTGTSIHPDELRRIHEVVKSHGGITLVDEIYLALSFDKQFGQTALAIDDHIISINSFSKYFNMTGWRLGWMVVPDVLVPVIERLAQNLFICPSTIAQHAALACFEADSIALYEQRRSEFKARRDYFIPELNAMGLTVPVMPDGAFYAWADCSAACAKLGVKDSWDFAFAVMNQAHVAITPGKDFGAAQTHNLVRFSTASSMEQLQIAVARLRSLLS